MVSLLPESGVGWGLGQAHELAMPAGQQGRA